LGESRRYFGGKGFLKKGSPSIMGVEKWKREISPTVSVSLALGVVGLGGGKFLSFRGSSISALPGENP